MSKATPRPFKRNVVIAGDETYPTPKFKGKWVAMPEDFDAARKIHDKAVGLAQRMLKLNGGTNIMGETIPLDSIVDNAKPALRLARELLKLTGEEE